MIPYGKQNINQADIDSVVKVLKSNFLTQGPNLPRFEEAITEYTNSNYSIAVNSATSALHIACLSLGLGEGDWLWTSPNSFVASSNCGLLCNANIDFVDIDPISLNMCPVKLEQKLIQAKSINRLPKVVIPVHFAGQSCDMQKIHMLSEEYGFRIIEDASHAIGSKYLGERVGSCRFSDITVFSFHPVKIITTAEGGIATTNSEFLAQKMKLLRSHGISRDSSLMDEPSDAEWYYEQLDLGFNYRMTEIQAALGLSQLERLDEFVLRRHKLKNRYDTFLENLPLIIPFQSNDCFSSFHLYPIQVDLKKIKKSRKQIFDFLRARGIGVNVHYIPIHSQPYYKNLGFKIGDFPNSENYYKKAISIPLHSGMSLKQQDIVVNGIKASFN